MSDPRMEVLKLYQYIADLKFGDEGMKHKVYTVYDSKAECYMLPIYKRADGEAVRAFEVSVADPNHQFGMNPADYTLFGIGEYDDDKARFLQYDAFVNLGNGAQFVGKVKSNG